MAPSPRNTHLLSALAVLLITFGVHAPSIGGDFVFDDVLCVKVYDDELQRPHEMIATLHPVSEYFMSHYLRGASEGSRSYRPLSVLSYAVTFHLFCGGRIEDDSAVPHHAINVILQVLNTWFVLLILRRLCGGSPYGSWAAVVGALVFGVDAIHTEVVAGIVGRGELMGFGFGAASLLLFLRAVEHTGGGSRRRRLLYLGAAGVAQFLAFCSKESALAWFAFLPLVRLVQHFLDPNVHVRRDVRDAILLGVVPVALFLGLYAYVITNAPEYQTSYLTNPIHGAFVPISTRVLTAIVVWGYAIYLNLAPFALSCDYGASVFPLAESLADVRVWFAGVALATLVGGGFAVARRHPLLFLAMGCFFGFSLIASNVVMSQETIFAERNYYTPSLALAIVVAWVFGRQWNGWIRRVLGAVVAIWLVACGVVDVQRMYDWRNNETLFMHDLEHQPRSLRLLNCVANLHESANRPREYFETLQASLLVEPEDPKTLIRMARFFLERKQYPLAADALRRCQESRLLRVINAKEHESRLYKLLGHLREAEGKFPEAIAMFQRGAQIDPSYPHLIYSLVRAQVRAGQLVAADSVLAEARQRFANDAVLEMLTGKVLFHQKRYSEAEQVLRGALPRLAWGTFRLDDVLDFVESLVRLDRQPEAMRILQGYLQRGGGEVPQENRARIERLRKS